MVNVWPASVLRRSVLAISTILACVANSKKKELIKRSGRKDLYVLIELDIFLATVGPKIDKKSCNNDQLFNWDLKSPDY